MPSRSSAFMLRSRYTAISDLLRLWYFFDRPPLISPDVSFSRFIVVVLATPPPLQGSRRQGDSDIAGEMADGLETEQPAGVLAAWADVRPRSDVDVTRSGI